MTIREILLESHPESEFLLADGFDDAIIGVTIDDVVVYSVTKCIEILMHDMSEDEALEYFEFNVAGGYVGEKTPIWVYDDWIN